METKNKKIKPITGIIIIALVIGIANIGTISAIQDPYPLVGYVKDKAGTGLVGASITFTNQNTSEEITGTSVTNGAYSLDADSFSTDYANGNIIEYNITYSGMTYQNNSYTHTINTTIGSNNVNIILDQAPTVPTSPTDLGMNLVDHTPAITWTKGTDADGGDTVTTYVYVGTGASPTTEEINNTGTGADLGSTVSLTDGTTYYYRLRSYDGERWSAYTSDDTFRMNTPPTVGTVNITPATAYTDSALTGDGTYADTEDDAESDSTYKWFRNGSVLTDNTTTSLTTNMFVRGDVIIFQYTPNDSYEAGTPINSSAITISNSVPTVPTTLTLNTTIYMGDVLAGAGSGSTDTDTGDGDPSLIYYYEFKEGVDLLAAYSTTNTYTITLSEAHDTITVNCKAYDGITYSSVKTETKVVSDTKPTTPTGSSIAGTTKYVGDTLTVTGAGSTDVDGDVTYRYEFRRGSVSGTIVRALSDVTTYTLTTADAHDTIYVLVYGREYSTDSDAYEAENRVVTNSVPVLAAIGAKGVDDNVLLTVDADATDGDDDTRTYSCNRTDLFSDFSTSTGAGTWTPFYNQTGVYHVNFSVSDGYGGSDNETITITITDVTFNTNLFSGWNLLAWVSPTNGYAEDFNDTISNVAYVTKRNTTTGDYENYDPGVPEVHNFTTIKGMGYYVSTTETTPFSQSQVDNQSYETSLVSGWNIMGWTNHTTWTAQNTATDVGGNCQFISLKNATTSNYDTFTVDIPEINNFDVVGGIGHYVRVSTGTNWVRDS